MPVGRPPVWELKLRSGERLTLDEHGGLVDRTRWCTEVLALLCGEHGVLLGARVGELVVWARGWYAERGVAPMSLEVCRERGLALDVLYMLLPDGARTLSLISGLPRPGCGESRGERGD